MEIRKLKVEDLDRVLEITKVSFSQPWPRSEFEKYIGESFITEEDGKVIGFVVGKISGNTGCIKLIAVDQGHRGKGIGRKLIEHLLNYFQENLIKVVLARSRTKNEKAIAFLKNLGFKITETLENYYPNGENAYLMEKDLGE